jgi:predicted phosphoribosyltransferase
VTPAVVVVGDADQLDEAAELATRWRAAIDVVPVVPIVDPDEPRVVLGAVSSRGERALDRDVVCGMGYDASELAAATAVGVQRAARLEAELRPGPAPHLDGAVVGVVPVGDRFGRVVMCADVRRRGAGRVLLVGEDAASARAAGADGPLALPAPETQS